MKKVKNERSFLIVVTKILLRWILGELIELVQLFVENEAEYTAVCERFVQ